MPADSHYSLVRSETMRTWLAALRDRRARAMIAARLERAAKGHFGEVKPVGDSIYEMRIHYGPGYRLYYTIRDGRIILLLCGGDKSTQGRDIKTAKQIARQIP